MEGKITKELWELVRKTRSLCRAIDHPIRMKMLVFLNVKGSACVTEIQHEVGLVQSETSQHLRVLREAGLVIAARDQLNGKLIQYSVDTKNVSHIVDSLSNLIYCTPSLKTTA